MLKFKSHSNEAQLTASELPAADAVYRLLTWWGMLNARRLGERALTMPFDLQPLYTGSVAGTSSNQLTIQECDCVCCCSLHTLLSKLC